MIDQATDWIEIHYMSEVITDLVANKVELAWLIRHSLSNERFVDKGKELFVKLKTMMANGFGFLCNSINTRNPQGNTFVVRVHQIIGNIKYTFKIQNIDF